MQRATSGLKPRNLVEVSTAVRTVRAGTVHPANCRRSDSRPAAMVDYRKTDKLDELFASRRSSQTSSRRSQISVHEVVPPVRVIPAPENLPEGLHA